MTVSIPNITLKVGMSIDGKIATNKGESQWITNTLCRNNVQQLRHNHDAVLVGVGTTLMDNPSLTSRIPHGKNPIRIILDTSLRTPMNANVVTDGQAPVWIVVNNQVAENKIKQYERLADVKIIQVSSPIIELITLLEYLFQNGIKSILVEGGSQVFSSFIQQRLFNQLILFISPILIGGVNAPALFLGDGFNHLVDALQLKFTSIEAYDDNLKIVATNIAHNKKYEMR